MLRPTIQRSLALFWFINALLFLLNDPAPGAPSLSPTLALFAGFASMLFAAASLSPKHSALITSAQLLWLIAEPILLAMQDLYYLVHPLGLCSKNIPILLLLFVTLQEATREQQTRGARLAVAIVWLTEGILPKMLFQQEMELNMAVWFFQGIIAPSLSLYLIGAAQAGSAILSLLLPPHLARLILIAQLLGLVFLPALVLLYDASYALFLFAPLFKNIPIFAATYWLASPSSDLTRASAERVVGEA